MARNQATQKITAFARHFLQSEEYRQSMKHRILAGKAPQLQTLLYEYAFGKPQVGLDPSGAGGGPVPRARVVLYDAARESEDEGAGGLVRDPRSPTRPSEPRRSTAAESTG